VETNQKFSAVSGEAEVIEEEDSAITEEQLWKEQEQFYDLLLQQMDEDLNRDYQKQELDALKRVQQRLYNNETPIIISSWSDDPKEELLDTPVGENYSLTSRRAYLARIAQQLDKFLYRAIQLPGYTEPISIREVLVHVSDVTAEHSGTTKLFWGRAKYATLDKHYLRIDFYYRSHEIAFWIPSQIAKQHRWTPNWLFGRLVIVAGHLEQRKNCSNSRNLTFQADLRWRVRVEHWGQIALISPRNASLVLQKNNENLEYTPEPDEADSGEGRSDEQVKSWEFGSDDCQSRNMWGDSRETGNSAEVTDFDFCRIAEEAIEKFEASSEILSQLLQEDERAGRGTGDCPEANELRLIADRFRETGDRFREIGDELQGQLESFDL